MSLTRKEQKALLLGALIFLLILAGHLHQVRADGEIPVTGTVSHVHRSDGSHKTYLHVVVGSSFAGKLPADINSITVIGPGGELPIGKDDFNYDPQWRTFWLVRSGCPQTGKYTFKLTGENSFGSATDIQSTVETIPIPDASTFSPVSADTVSCSAPTFSWSLIKEATPLYYQLQIRDSDRNDVYRTDYVRDMSSVRVSPGVLMPGTTYQWRILVADGPDWITLDNRSQSRWVAFPSSQSTKPCRYRYAVPKSAYGDWKVGSLEEAGINPDKIAELMVALLNGNIQDIHSLLIVKNGRLVLEEYFYGHACNKIHSVMSVTKSITSLLIGIARDRKKMPDLDTKLSEFFPSYKDIVRDDLKGSIRLRHVLSMTAGLAWNDWAYPDTDPRSTSQEMIRSADWIKFVLERKAVDAPGEKFVYSNGLSMLLGGVLKYSTGMQADKFAEKYLFEPLGISDFKWQKRPDGDAVTAWGLQLRPRDMAKIGYMMLKDGSWNGKQIVSSSWVSDSTKAHVEGGVFLGSGYGYQWWCGQSSINNQTIETFYAAGKGGQYIFICPDLDLVTIFTSKVEDHDMGELKPQLLMVNHIIPAMLPPVEPPESIELDSDILETYAGDYTCERIKLPLTIYKQDGRLGFRTAREAGELFPETQTRFHGTSKAIGDFRADFIKNSRGQTDRIDVHVGFGIWQFDRVKQFLR